jgi:microcystin-dependent protein
MATVKTGNAIRHRGVYRLYHNGATVSETPYNLTDAFGSTPAITLEKLQKMPAPMIEARAAAMINDIADRCYNFKIINNVIIYESDDCSDEEEFMIGQIIDYAGLDGKWDNTKWLKCDGSTVNVNDYPELYDVIGREWTDGGVSGTQFQLPNLRGRVTLGYDETAQSQPQDAAGTLTKNYKAVGNIGGLTGVSLSKEQNGQHAHSTETFSRRGYPDGSGDRTDNYYFISRTNDPSHTTELTVNTSGNGAPHENRQPYAVVFKLIRYKEK